MISVILALALTSAQDSNAWDGRINERLASPVVATLTSAKAPASLELCVANALTAAGTPVAFRNGPNEVVILASYIGGNAYPASATITATSGGSRIDLRVRGKGYDDRLRERLTRCL